MQTKGGPLGGVGEMRIHMVLLALAAWTVQFHSASKSRQPASKSVYDQTMFEGEINGVGDPAVT
jgi:hypothetical protein